MSRIGVATRREARWLVMHRGARTLFRHQARKGNPLARLLFEPGARDDPYPLLEEIRAAGRTVPNPLINATTDHALVSGMLRDSQAFSVVFGDTSDVPRVVRWAFNTPDPEIASPVDAPSLLAVDPPRTPAIADWSPSLSPLAPCSRSPTGSRSARSSSSTDCKGWAASTSSPSTPTCCRSRSSPRSSACRTTCTHSSSPGAMAQRRSWTSG